MIMIIMIILIIRHNTGLSQEFLEHGKLFPERQNWQARGNSQSSEAKPWKPRKTTNGERCAPVRGCRHIISRLSAFGSLADDRRASR